MGWLGEGSLAWALSKTVQWHIETLQWHRSRGEQCLVDSHRAAGARAWDLLIQLLSAGAATTDAVKFFSCQGLYLKLSDANARGNDVEVMQQHRHAP